MLDKQPTAQESHVRMPNVHITTPDHLVSE